MCNDIAIIARGWGTRGRRKRLSVKLTVDGDVENCRATKLLRAAQNSCHISRVGCRGGRKHPVKHMSSPSVGSLRTLPSLNQLLPGANPSHQCALMLSARFKPQRLSRHTWYPLRVGGFTPGMIGKLGEKNFLNDVEKREVDVVLSAAPRLFPLLPCDFDVSHNHMRKVRRQNDQR